jgi:hypothetical protein
MLRKKAATHQDGIWSQFLYPFPYPHTKEFPVIKGKPLCYLLESLGLDNLLYKIEPSTNRNVLLWRGGVTMAVPLLVVLCKVQLAPFVWHSKFYRSHT